MLLGRAANKDFVIVADQISSRRKMINTITSYENDTILFLFSGHAGPDQLSLTDGEGDSDGIAGLLGKCKKLELVILNGCSTVSQVAALLNNGVPIVIATSAPVGDQTATQFSISFFKELSNGSTIRDAFNRSIQKARVYGKIEGAEITSRGLVTGEEKTDQPLWGVYYLPEQESLLDTWQLPMDLRPTTDKDINIDLIQSLKDISEKDENNIVTAAPGENVIDNTMGRLPYMISEPIRKLRALPQSGDKNESMFYVSGSKERFGMLLFAYRAVINLCTYILLAELWDKGLMEKDQAFLTAECRNLIESTLFNVSTTENSPSTLRLLQLLLEIINNKKPSLENKKSPYFLEEVDSLYDELNKDESKKALEDLEKKLLEQTILSKNPGMLRLCLETEKSFAEVLYVFGFMIKYNLTSVPTIEYLKYGRQSEPFYRHRIVKVFHHDYMLEEKDDHISSISSLDSTSVILGKYSVSLPEYNLNLSPFLVDKNAFEKSTKADLHYLLFYLAKGEVFNYQCAASIDKKWPIKHEPIAQEKSRNERRKPINKTEYEPFSNFYSLLNKQLESFARVVLNKTLSEL